MFEIQAFLNTAFAEIVTTLCQVGIVKEFKTYGAFVFSKN